MKLSALSSLERDPYPVIDVNGMLDFAKIRVWVSTFQPKAYRDQSKNPQRPKQPQRK